VDSERGAITFGPVVGVIVIVLALIGLFAVCGDEDADVDDEVGIAWIADHEYDYDDEGSGNEGEYRDDNRRAGISPGPFDRSPVDFRNNRVVICFPFSRCDSAGEEEAPPSEGSPI